MAHHHQHGLPRLDMDITMGDNVALERWKQLDLQRVQNQSDIAAAEIASYQEQGENSRKRLIELSKDFRTTVSDEVRKQVQPLLKAFQTEVDGLLKRSKSGESAFLYVYKTLRDLPDPTSILQHIRQLEICLGENKQLRASLEEYHRHSAANKLQDDHSNRVLLDEFERKLKEAVDVRVASVEAESSRHLLERESQWLQEKAGMERRLNDAEEQVGILRRELDRSHPEVSPSRSSLGHSAAEDEKIALLAEDLDRANQRATAAEFKIAELQQHLTSLQKQVNKSQQDLMGGSEERMSTRGQQLQQDSVQRLRDELERLKTSYQSQFTRMEDQLARLGSQNSALLNRLDSQRDYDQIKQELSLLKSAHYAEDMGNGSLESVLLARNRRLESENAGLRVREVELSGLRSHRTNGNGHGLGNGNGHLDSHSHNGHYGRNCNSDGETDGIPSPEEDEYSDDLSDLETDLTPETMAKIAEAKGILQTLSARANSGGTARFMNTLEVADQVNRVLEEEAITRCALAKFVLHGSYKMVYDALHDPRPWGFLNSAGRDKYRKLKLWAEDVRSVNAVKVLQVYCKDKRRNSTGDSASATSFPNQESHTHSHSHSQEMPTDLSIPKGSPALRRKGSLMPQMESLLAGCSDTWLPRSSSAASLSASMSIPRRLYSQKESSESHPYPQSLPVASKRPSPQHSVPRRQPKETLHLSQPQSSPVSSSAGSGSVFRPSASFTASPVALGISFPDYRKNVLHQITDDMINQYDPLDTDVVTRAVRSKLNKCNVSQRLFGEVVLGMSQGAVSDLLKRPKPWNKLTRPTKEHYVRMQQFLEDDQSIPVLQAIQNREDPERVLAAPPEREEEEEQDTRTDIWKKGSSPQSSSPPSMVGLCAASSVILSSPANNDAPPISVGIADSELSEREAFQAVKDHFAKFYQITDVSRNASLDTVAVASKIKEELRSRNLQQKLIGELVLDVGQGTVSELLNKPKPFGMLSMKGRENYMKLLKLLQTCEDFTLLEALRTQGQQKDALNRLEREYNQQKYQVDTQRKLVESLENDLFQLHKRTYAPRLLAEGRLTFKEPDFITDALRSTTIHRSATLSDGIGEFGQVSGQDEQSLLLPAEDDSISVHTDRDREEVSVYMPILVRQLARFDHKQRDLEADNANLQSQLITARAELESCRCDNIGLYERIRFLQSYQCGKGGSTSTDGPNERTSGTILAVSGRKGERGGKGLEERYSWLYEDSIDPFTSYIRGERQRKYHSLNSVDKATLAMGKMILGNSSGRKLFLVYAVLLHLLVFGIIYKMALSESNLRDFSYDCATRFAEHMHREHHR